MTALSQKPIGRILFDLMVAWKVRWWPLVGLTVFAMVYLSFQNNLMWIPSLILAAIFAFFVIGILPTFRKEWIGHEKTLDHVALVGATVIMTTPLFLFWNPCLVALDRGDGTTTYLQEQLRPVPYSAFTDAGWGYEENMSVGFGGSTDEPLRCVNGNIRTLVGVQMRLDSADLPRAHQRAGSHQSLTQLRNNEICKQVGAALAMYAPEHMPSTLAIELRAQAAAGVSSLGLRYDGEFVIFEIDAYNKQ